MQCLLHTVEELHSRLGFLDQQLGLAILCLEIL